MWWHTFNPSTLALWFLGVLGQLELNSAFLGEFIVCHSLEKGSLVNKILQLPLLILRMCFLFWKQVLWATQWLRTLPEGPAAVLLELWFALRLSRKHLPEKRFLWLSGWPWTHSSAARLCWDQRPVPPLPRKQLKTASSRISVWVVLAFINSF